jgi:hypothetical protein
MGNSMENVKTVVRSDALSQRELALIADSLATAALEFADRSCNDFSFPATTESRAIGEAIAKHVDPGYWDTVNTLSAFLAQITAAKERVVVYDNWAAGYFSELCRRLAALTPAGPLASAELAIITQLLESSAEDHEGWQGDGRDDLDLTLEPTAEHRALVTAAVRHQAPRGWKAKLSKIEKATGPISLPDFQLMRYLAARCEALAAVTDATAGASILSARAALLAGAATARTAGAVPVVERAGIASRFPPLKRYLTAYFQSFENWQREQLPRLERYAAGEAGTTGSPDGKFTVEFAATRQSLFECSLAPRWHAVQTALGGDIALGKKAKIRTLKATEREFAKLIEDGERVHMQSPPALTARYFEDLHAPDFDEFEAGRVDSQISRAEFDIVRHLLFKGHAPEQLQQVLLTLGPQLAARKGEDAANYAAYTVERAATDPLLREWREQNEPAAAAADRDAFQRTIGKDWLTPWRRSVAYDYWFCCMAAHSGERNYWFNNIVGTAVDCLVLGWEKEAHRLVRQVWAHIDARRFGHITESNSPTQYFLLRLIADSQGEARTGDGEPLFAALLAHWQTPDVEVLAPLILALCDRHTQEAAKTDAWFGMEATYFPFAVLAVLRLRQLRGLKNPTLEHPLLNTPLGTLPPVTKLYADELLDGVVKQARLKYQDLRSLSRRRFLWVAWCCGVLGGNAPRRSDEMSRSARPVATA